MNKKELEKKCEQIMEELNRVDKIRQDLVGNKNKLENEVIELKDALDNRIEICNYIIPMTNTFRELLGLEKIYLEKTSLVKKYPIFNITTKEELERNQCGCD
jgi:predicted nuclease with TOPRIM domain